MFQVGDRVRSKVNLNATDTWQLIIDDEGTVVECEINESAARAMGIVYVKFDSDTTYDEEGAMPMAEDEIVGL